MLAEQAAQNAAQVEEAYGGFAQSASSSSLPLTLPSLLPGSGSSHVSLGGIFCMKYRRRIRRGIMERHRSSSSRC